jgi:hypothetical protein
VKATPSSRRRDDRRDALDTKYFSSPVRRLRAQISQYVRTVGWPPHLVREADARVGHVDVTSADWRNCVARGGRADVGRTGAPISTAESKEETHLGLSSNPVAPTISQTQIPPLVAEATGDGI